MSGQQQLQQPQIRQDTEEEAEYEWEEDVEIPHVDDLEVAAAAAEADLEAAAIYQRSAPRKGDAMETSDSSSEEEGDVDMAAAPAAGTSLLESMLQAGSERVSVSLKVTEDGSVAVKLAPQPVDSDESEWDDSDSDVAVREDLRAVLASMEVDGEDARAAAREAAELEAALPPVEPLDVTIAEGDSLLPLGSITAVLGDRIVIQAPEGGRAVEEGSVVCLPDRTPLGRIEEIFGPVDAPLYCLRFASGGAALPPAVAPGAAACCLERLTTFILPESIQAGAAAPLDEEDEEDGEGDASDGEQDAETALRKAAAASAGRGGAMQPGRGGGRGGRGRSRGPGRGPGPARGGPGRQPQAGGRRGGRRGGRGPPPHMHGRRGFPPQGQAGLPPGGQWVWVPQGQQPAQPPPHFQQAQPPAQQQYWGGPQPQPTWRPPFPQPQPQSMPAQPAFYPQSPLPPTQQQPQAPASSGSLFYPQGPP